MYGLPLKKIFLVVVRRVIFGYRFLICVRSPLMSSSPSRYILLALLVFFSNAFLQAQAPPISNVPGTNPLLYGLPVQCSDINGAPVYFVFGQINDIARSSMDPTGHPIMTFSPAAQNAPVPLLIFIYAHECMHHALGHIYTMYVLHQPPPQSLEVDADCGAAKLVRNQGLVTQQQIVYVASQFMQNPPMGPYPAGPVRAQNIVNCYNNPP
jgi:hypothetical protein